MDHLTYRFAYKREEGANPMIGFTSFQHFRGGLLYDDIVVRPENRMTETERVECYPVSPDAAETAVGYCPAGDIAYIRVLWKEFEPVQGEFRYTFIKDILRAARAAGQHVMLRLMAHSTRWQDDVPAWLRSIISCPERPDMMRVKDSPTDPRFLKLFGTAVRVLGNRFDSDPTLACVDISMPGAWGEGHKLELFPKEDIRALTQTYLDSFPNTRLYCQAGAPWLVNDVCRTHSVGVRADGLGEPKHTHERYPQVFSELPADLWQKSPVSFESYWWLGEWKRRGWDLDEIIESTLGWHVSSFNGKSMPIPEEWRPKIERWIDRMGYHFHLSEAVLPASASCGTILEGAFTIENLGVAPPYEAYPVTVRLTAQNGAAAEFPLPLDVRTLLPGVRECRFALPLPNDFTVGPADLSVRCGHPEAPVHFCSDLPAGNVLGSAMIGA